MIRTLLPLAVFSLVSISTIPFSVGKDASLATVTVRAERQDAIYKQGEEVRFLITLPASKSKEPVTVNWTVALEARLAPYQKGTLQIIPGQKAVVSTRLDAPGFILCRAKIGDEKAQASGGAAVNPTEIKATQTLPDDFLAFWQGQLAELAKVPLDAVVEPVTTAVEGIEVFDVTVKSVGENPVRGYLALPKGAKPGTLPAIISYHGAGVNSSQKATVEAAAKRGLIAFNMNAHGIANGQPAEFYAALKTGALAGYPLFGRESRETSYFRTMFLRAVRGIDFLASRPEWNGRTLIAQGSSQGGAQTLAVAGLDRRVSFFIAQVTAMAEHSGLLSGAATGWPRWIPIDKNAPKRQEMIEAARYYDMSNFARYITAPGFMTVGFIDATCPPATVYAVYNAIKTPKSMYNDVTAGHNNSAAALAAIEAAKNTYVSEAR